MKRNAPFLALFFAFLASSCEKLNSFESQCAGNWVSVSYVVNGVDKSVDHIAKLQLEDNHDFQLDYPYQEGIGYVLSYSLDGKWSGEAGSQALSFENYDLVWQDLNALLLAGDTLQMSGKSRGSLIEMRLIRQ